MSTPKLNISTPPTSKRGMPPVSGRKPTIMPCMMTSGRTSRTYREKPPTCELPLLDVLGSSAILAAFTTIGATAPMGSAGKGGLARCPCT
jgi:hypothetical protein